MSVQNLATPQKGVVFVRDINSLDDSTGTTTLSLKQITNTLKYSYTLLTAEKFGEVK